MSGIVSFSLNGGGAFLHSITMSRARLETIIYSVLESSPVPQSEYLVDIESRQTPTQLLSSGTSDRV